MTAPNAIRRAVKQLGIEMRIMSALTAYAEEAGSDTEIEVWQEDRVNEAFEELQKLVGEPDYPEAN